MAEAHTVETEATIEYSSASECLIIAVDFGTTFSSVAYATVSTDTPRDALDIKCISSYPDNRHITNSTYDPESSREDVPTELWYNLNARKNGKTTASHTSGELCDSGADYSNDSEMDGEFTDDEDREYDRLFWGFGVQKHLRKMDIPKDGTTRLTRFKLMLDEGSSETNDVRNEILPILKKLKKKEVVREVADLIRDYLEQLFIHTKAELQGLKLLRNNTSIELVLCVPAVWPAKACRIMQTAMFEAVQLSGLGSWMNNRLDNLFIVSEPEAAAACVLAEDNNDIYENETIVVIDAGGGTIDAVTYKITKSRPLRLSAEIVPSTTKLCGASYINERYEELLLNRLQDETYLEKNGKTIKSIVEAKVIEFENGEKRQINTVKERFGVERVYIDDLRRDDTKRFSQNRLVISRREMRDVFEMSLKGAADLLTEQLELAKAKEHPVQKVILIGGFGQSPSLRAHLRAVLASERNSLDQEIKFLTPHVPSTVVARGAVLRALDKDDGPDRITSCSYGFLRTEPWEPEHIPAHSKVKCHIDKTDGEKYVDNTINWLIQKYQKLPHHMEFDPITVRHTFPLYRRELICIEEVYVSDNVHESHYRKSHAMNKGAEFAGKIEVDMTFLKEKGYIQPQPPSVFSTYSGRKALNYWSVEFQLVMIVDGRNLRYEARWPIPQDNDQNHHEQNVQAKGQISIAAAFKPGTA
ncbi:hypothetical protein BGZ60DRAFT_365995 [Tricladium varicosporioides]|nr:hypothetical protein BGZ60DRAFT_365995 [Hymenoscyphus varicosporioides]